MSQPWMPLYIADYLADTAHLNATQSGAYLHLIMHYWRAGALPKDEGSLARIARMTSREWTQSRDVILAFFDADLRHKRIDKELEKSRAISEKRKAVGALGGKAKALKNNDAPLANATDLPQQTLGKTLDNHNHSHIVSSSLRSEETETRAGRARSAAVDEAFDRFWAAWPNKVGKPAARKAFTKHAGDVEAILAGVERYVRGKPADRPWLNPATYLNQERWTDQPADMATAGPSLLKPVPKRTDVVGPRPEQSPWAKRGNGHENGLGNSGGIRDPLPGAGRQHQDVMPALLGEPAASPRPVPFRFN